LPDFEKWDKASDVIKLLTKIESIAFGAEGEEPALHGVYRAIKKFINVHQEGWETELEYNDKVDSAIKGLDTVWGEPFVPPKLAGSTATTKETARQEFLAFTYIQGANNKKYRNLKDKFHNDRAAGVDKAYPQTLELAKRALLQYQGPTDSRSGRNGQDRPPPVNNSGVTSFHQQGQQDDDDISDYEEVSDNQSTANHPNRTVNRNDSGRTRRSIFSSWE